jgi:hypothetical protein
VVEELRSRWWRGIWRKDFDATIRRRRVAVVGGGGGRGGKAVAVSHFGEGYFGQMIVNARKRS